MDSAIATVSTSHLPQIKILIYRYSDEDPGSIMAAAVVNETCDPFTSRKQPCLPGASVAFSVNASGPADFAKAIRFAQTKNIRLVIHNTGHE